MNKATSSLVVLLLFLLAPLSARGQSFTDPTAQILPAIECATQTCEAATAALARQEFNEAAALFTALFEESIKEGSQAESQEGLWLVYAAFSQERAQRWDEAASLYHQAAQFLPPLQNYLLAQAVRASLEGAGNPEIIGSALKANALGAGYRGESFLRARTQAFQAGLPEPETLAAALQNDGADEVCSWLHSSIASRPETNSPPEHLELAYSHCIDKEWSDFFARTSFTPTSQARQARAERLFWAVRFKDALSELDRLDMDDLSPVQQCKATFRRARSHFRLRQYQSAHEIYNQVVQQCTDDANESERVQSLYAMGNRDFHTNKLDEAEASFKALLDQYPYRSHADDALFYLARIARQGGEHEKEKALLIRALSDYPQGDMVHEMAWEVYASLFRSGDYQGFIDAVTTLPLPDWDDQYFSQGRLEYFIAASHANLGDLDQATRYWQLAWVKYPFSFYGYLSNLRLRERDIEPEPLATFDEAHTVSWFHDGTSQAGAELLASAGHLTGACDFAAASLVDGESDIQQRWQTALFCHRAGRFDFSHNLVRRQISGRPWTFPLEGQLVRWHLAWPNPFAAQIKDAVEKHGPTEEAQRLSPAFPSAIMREESSFIEDIVSWAGAVGLMQLMPATARDHESVIEGRATVERLKTAEVNIPIGVDHLAHLSRRFDGHPVLMTAAYNAGAGRVNSWLRRQPSDEIALWVEDIPFLETRNYTKRVIGSYGAYQFLGGQSIFDSRVAKAAR